MVDNGNHHGIVVDGLVRTFGGKGKDEIRAVDGIDLHVASAL